MSHKIFLLVTHTVLSQDDSQVWLHGPDKGEHLRKMKGCFYACSLFFFLFVPSWVITINCAMRAVQRWVYREASTNPSSAFSPSFLEAIAYHIFTVLFLTARIKVDFTTQSLKCPFPPKWRQRGLLVYDQQNRRHVKTPIHLVFMKTKYWVLRQVPYIH
jgi:hypothetical protein